MYLVSIEFKIRNMSRSLGESYILWENELQVSISTDSFSEFSQTFTSVSLT